MNSRRVARSLLCLILAAGCSDDGTAPSDEDPAGPLLRGTVHAVGGGSVDDLWAVWRAGGSSSADSARVHPDGSFEIRASLEQEEDDAGQLLYSCYFGQPEPRNNAERLLLDLLVWPLEDLPALVAIDHAASSGPMPAVIGERRVLLGASTLPTLDGGS